MHLVSTEGSADAPVAESLVESQEEVVVVLVELLRVLSHPTFGVGSSTNRLNLLEVVLITVVHHGALQIEPVGDVPLQCDTSGETVAVHVIGLAVLQPVGVVEILVVTTDHLGSVEVGTPSG